MQTREMNLSLGELPTVPLEGPDPRGGTVDVTDYKGRERVLVYLYPLDDRDEPTQAFIDLEERLDELEERDTALLLVMGDRYATRHEDLDDVAVPILMDRDYHIAQAFHLMEEDGRETAPQRALVLLDKDTRVVEAWHDTGQTGLVEDVLRTVRAQASST